MEKKIVIFGDFNDEKVNGPEFFKELGMKQLNFNQHFMATTLTL